MAKLRVAKEKEESVTYEQIAALLAYDPETGEFTWVVDRPPHTRKSRRAGSEHGGGYRQIAVLGKKFMAHRLAWFMVHKRWPAMYLDHIDGDPSNNRISNLRECDDAQNGQNRRAKAKTASGHIGVHFCKTDRVWVANIMVRRKQYRLGRYKDRDEAIASYLKAKAELHQFQPAPRVD